MAAVHGISVTADNVIVSCGAKHSLYNVLSAVLDPGDEVIVPAPCWVSYVDMVRLTGGEPVIVQASANDGFIATVEALRSAIGPRTRAIMVNSPCNPSGAVYDRAQCEAIASLALEHGLLIITDDIYRHLVYDGAQFQSFAALGPEVAAQTIIIDGLSKAYAMPGWRMGFTCGPEVLIDAMIKIQSQTTSGTAHVSQIAALAALTGPQACVAAMREAFDERRQVMLAGMDAIDDVVCFAARGAFYVFPDISAYLGRRDRDGGEIGDDVALCAYLLSEARVAAVPGSGFCAPGYMRLSYACSLDMVKQGIARITEALRHLG